MNVDVLQLHLTNLGQLLRSAGGQKTANELEEFCQLLQPFRDKKIKDLVAIIALAEEMRRNGPAAPRARSSSGKTAQVSTITARIVDLYRRAAQPDVSREDILAVFIELEGLKLAQRPLEQIAVQIDVSEKFKKKSDLFNRMRQSILDRKGAADRVHV